MILATIPTIVIPLKLMLFLLYVSFETKLNEIDFSSQEQKYFQSCKLNEQTLEDIRK
jgi:hypothetical protein